MKQQLFSQVKILCYLAFSVFLASCGASKPVLIDTIRPADIGVNPQIQTLLLVDRTKVDKNNWLNIGEGLLTGEMPFEDRALAQEALNSIKNKLHESPRFYTKVATERLAGNSLTAVFPNPVPWNVQTNLLRKYEADALLMLEMMDSDFIMNVEKRRVERTVGSGENRRTVMVDEWVAEGIGNLKMGFRFYNPNTKEIIDQQLINENQTWTATGDSKTDALGALISKNAANMELSRMAARDYAYKIAPLPVTLRRSFYSKSKEIPALEIGARQAEVGNWQEALKTWEQAMPFAKHAKDKARMAHNIAVGYEVLGDFEKAEKWAQDAYVKFGNKASRSYVGLLNERIISEERAKQQLQGN